MTKYELITITKGCKKTTMHIVEGQKEKDFLKAVECLQNFWNIDCQLNKEVRKCKA